MVMLSVGRFSVDQFSMAGFSMVRFSVDTCSVARFIVIRFSIQVQHGQIERCPV
jgi:hypothetical protein